MRANVGAIQYDHKTPHQKTMTVNLCKKVNQSDFVHRLYTLQHETYGARCGRQTISIACPPIQRRGGGGRQNGAGLQYDMDSYSHKISQKEPCQDSPKKPAIVRPYYLPCNAFWSHGRTVVRLRAKKRPEGTFSDQRNHVAGRGQGSCNRRDVICWNLSGRTRSASPPAHRIDEAGGLGRSTGPVVALKDEQGNMD